MINRYGKTDDEVIYVCCEDGIKLAGDKEGIPIVLITRHILHQYATDYTGSSNLHYLPVSE